MLGFRIDVNNLLVIIDRLGLTNSFFTSASLASSAKLLYNDRLHMPKVLATVWHQAFRTVATFGQTVSPHR